VRDDHGRLVLAHGGAGSGFLSSNAMWPAQKIAVIAFTNNDWVGPDGVVTRVASIVLPLAPSEARARKVLKDFQGGVVDRGLFTDNGNAYLTGDILADQKAGLASFGAARVVELQSETPPWRDGEQGLEDHRLEGRAPGDRARLSGRKLEQFMISKAD